MLDWPPGIFKKPHSSSMKYVQSNGRGKSITVVVMQLHWLGVGERGELRGCWVHSRVSSSSQESQMPVTSAYTPHTKDQSSPGFWVPEGWDNDCAERRVHSANLVPCSYSKSHCWLTKYTECVQSHAYISWKPFYTVFLKCALAYQGST